MQSPDERDPRTGRGPRAAEVSRAGRRGQGTATVRRPAGSTDQFAPAWPMTIEQVEQALADADCTQLARALDLDVRAATVTFRCPRCRQKDAHALGRFHWRCEDCQTLGTWIALRHEVACSVEATTRLCRIVLGSQAVA